MLYGAVRDAAARLEPDAVALCDLARPRVVVPVHYEGWSHFSQGRAEVERAFAGSPHDVRWLPPGEPVTL